jgi:hypothetical protein
MLCKPGCFRLAVFCLFILLAGCSPAASQATNPPQATPTTRLAASLAAPTSTHRPAPTRPLLTAASPLSTTAPLVTPRPTKPLADPTAAPQSLQVLDPIQIRAPGPGSQVLSPLALELKFALGEAGRYISLDLRAADGTLLARKLLDRQRMPPGEVYQDRLDFETAISPAAAYLIVQVESEAGVPLAVSSAKIELLAAGTARLLPGDWQAKAIDIQLPALQAKLQGGLLELSGLTRLDPAAPLKAQVLDLAGKVLGQRLAGIDSSSGGPFFPFAAQISYQVQQPTDALLVVYRDLPESGELLYLASQPVVLNP